MWRLETLRADISRPLAAAVEEILGLFEKTISEYEEKVSRLQEENNGQRELLGAAPSPRVVLHRAAFPPELQQLSVCKEELPPEQQEWSPSLSQEQPGLPHIKEEEEEFPVKGEHDEECAQWFQLHRRQNEETREAEPVANTSTEQMEAEVVEIEVEVDPEDPAAALEPSGTEQLLSSHCSEPETEDRDRGWKETPEPPSVKSHGIPCPGCWFSFSSQPFLHKHMRRSHSELYVQQLRSGEIREEGLLPSAASQPIGTSGTGRKQKDTPRHCCNQCERSFLNSGDLKRHQRIHTGEKLYRCEQCGKRFNTNSDLKIHLRIHTGEKPYRCDTCRKRFNTSGYLKIHQRIHTGEKPYRCEQCEKGFSNSGSLKTHQRLHTGEKPYCCEQCGRRFIRSTDMKLHCCIQTVKSQVIGSPQ